MNSLTIKDIPQAQLDRIRKVFEDAPQIRQLRVRQNLLTRNRDFFGALRTGKLIEDAWERTVSEVLKQLEEQTETVKIQDSGLSEDTKKKLDEYMVVLQLCIDIMNMCILDFNSAMHKEDPNLDMVAFNDIKDLHQIIKDKMEMFYKNSNIFHSDDFADKADNMYDMLRSKARSILRNAYKNNKK